MPIITGLTVILQMLASKMATISIKKVDLPNFDSLILLVCVDLFKRIFSNLIFLLQILFSVNNILAIDEKQIYTKTEATGRQWMFRSWKGILEYIQGTLITSLIEQFPEFFALSVSYTTRKPRQDEKDGREYYFVDRAHIL